MVEPVSLFNRRPVWARTGSDQKSEIDLVWLFNRKSVEARNRTVASRFMDIVAALEGGAAEGFEGFTAHDDRETVRGIFEEPEIVGQFPGKLVVDTDDVVLRSGYYYGNHTATGL